MEGATWQEAHGSQEELKVVFGWIAGKETGIQPYNHKKMKIFQKCERPWKGTLSSRREHSPRYPLIVALKL